MRCSLLVGKAATDMIERERERERERYDTLYQRIFGTALTRGAEQPPPATALHPICEAPARCAGPGLRWGRFLAGLRPVRSEYKIRIPGRYRNACLNTVPALGSLSRWVTPCPQI